MSEVLGSVSGDYRKDYFNPSAYGEVYGFRPNNLRSDTSLSWHLDAIANGVTGFHTESQENLGRSIGCVEEPEWWGSTTDDKV